MDIFEAFPEAIQTYTFLQLAQGGVYGNTVVKETDFGGILKERKGMAVNQNMELKESTSTLHIRPTEPFIAEVGSSLIGHGIRATKNGSTETYRVVGQPEGFNFDTGQLEFLYVTLKAEDLSTYGA